MNKLIDQKYLFDLKQRHALVSDELTEIAIQMADLGRKLRDALEEKRMLEIKIKKSVAMSDTPTPHEKIN